MLAAAAAGDDAAEQRARMVRAVESMVAETASMTGRPELSRTVRDAIAAVPRHEFVPESLRDEAYANRPLPIGEGQTISQPYIVALMTDLLGVGPGERVLEVGTGSGYQAAVLAEMGVDVFSIEIVPSLAKRAKHTLEALGYDRVHVRTGDGYFGWPDEAPFDGIIVTAAPDHVPEPLVEQLAPGGVLVIPVGERNGVQHLMQVTRDADGRVETGDVLPVRFVPLTGEH